MFNHTRKEIEEEILNGEWVKITQPNHSNNFDDLIVRTYYKGYPIKGKPQGFDEYDANTMVDHMSFDFSLGTQPGRKGKFVTRNFWTNGIESVQPKDCKTICHGNDTLDNLKEPHSKLRQRLDHFYTQADIDVLISAIMIGNKD
jgi:hypothetical protein